jgi:DNA-binding NarL/FixJ family response regulator
MSTHRVFVIWSHPLFYESIRLLLKNNHIEWLGASCSPIEARAEILESKPDTILVEDEENGSLSIGLINLFESNPMLRIFRLNLADNNLQIYHQEQRTVLQAEDLIKLITDEE